MIGRSPWWFGMATAGASAIVMLVLDLPVWPAALGLLLNGRHFAYVGETTAMNLRKEQHLHGGGRYDAMPKPWSDLHPTHYYLKLPPQKWLLRSVETMVIMLTWPVYNHRKNQWNPRRIPIVAARAQRAQRDLMGWCINSRFGHFLLAAVIAALTYRELR